MNKNIQGDFEICISVPLRVSPLLSLLNNVSVDVAEDESSFQFSPEAKFTSSLYVHIIFAADTEAEIQTISLVISTTLEKLSFFHLQILLC